MSFRPLTGTGPFAEHVRILASFHSDEGFDGVVGEGRQGFGFIVGATTHKQFGDAAGTWSLSIKVPPGQPPLLSQYADPGDVWVRIQARINGRVYDLMLGLVDSIAEDVTRAQDGSQVLTYEVSGRDFGKCFDHLELFVNFWPTGGPPIPQYVSYTATASKLALPLGSPNEVVRGLIQMWLGNNGAAEKQWMLPASLRGGSTDRNYIFDWINFGNISSGLRGTLANDPTLLSPDPHMGRSLWDVLQEYSNNLLNEMWVDLGIDPDLEDGAHRLDALRPTFYLRERPFPTIRSSRRWQALRTVEIGPGDVRRRHVVLGDGGVSRFNWWEVVPFGMSVRSVATQALLQRGEGLPGGMPIYNVESMRRHGVRRYAQQSKYFELPKDVRSRKRVDAHFFQPVMRWCRLVHDWYSVTPYQVSGTISLSRLRPDARIGMKLRETRADGSVWTYYIEGVEHQYQYSHEGGTTLTVTRGQREDVNLLERVYAYYRGVDRSSMSGSEVEAASGTAPEASETPDTAPQPEVSGDVPIPPEDALEAPTEGRRTQLEVVEIRARPTAHAGVHVVDVTGGVADPSMVTPPEDVESTDVNIDEIYGTPQTEIAVDGVKLEPSNRQVSPDRPTTGDNPVVSPTSLVGSGAEEPQPPATRRRNS